MRSACSEKACPWRSSTASRQISTPAEASSMTLSMPKATSVRLCATTPDAIATAASIVIQPIVIHSSQNALRTRFSRTRSWRAWSPRLGAATQPSPAQQGADAARSIVSGRFITSSYYVIGRKPTLVQAGLDLDGCVMDAESVLERVTRIVQQAVVEAGVRPHQVHGEGGLGGAHGPDVQVVHLGDARQARQIGLHRVAVDPGRNGVDREVERIAGQTPGGGEDDGGDRQADGGIEPQPAGPADQQ